MAQDPQKFLDHLENWRSAEGPILESVRGLGCSETSLMAFLAPSFTGTQELATALLPWVTQPVYPPVRNALLAILDLKWARPPGLFDALVTAFTDPRGSTDGDEFLLQLQAATVLGWVAEPRQVDTLIALAGDSGFGKARGPVVHALGRWRSLRDRVSATLLGLLDDPDVAGPAALALSKLQVKEAAPGIRALSAAPHLAPPFSPRPHACRRRRIGFRIGR